MEAFKICTVKYRRNKPYVNDPLPLCGGSANMSRISYPPGYVPGEPYPYYVRHTSILLRCSDFLPELGQNSTQIDQLLKRLVAIFGNPREQDREFFSNPHPTAWIQRERPYGAAYFSIRSQGVEDTTRLTYGQILGAIIGLNQLRLNYPKLDICCQVINVVQGRHDFNAFVFLEWSPDDIEDIGGYHHHT